MSIAKLEVDAWVDDLCEAWRKRDVAAALSLFAECKNYRETPFSENAAIHEASLEALWQEVLSQSDIRIDAHVRLVADDMACVEYRAAYRYGGQPRTSSGIWIVGFRDGACTSFEQWSVSKD